MGDAILAVDGLAKAFGAHKVLTDVSFQVGQGEIVGLLGPNGSGKSTLLNVVSGFSPLDAGRIRLLGEDVSTRPAHHIARRGLLRTFQLPSMPHRMTVAEVLRAGARADIGVRGALEAPAGPDREADQLLDQFALTPVRDQPASSLSGGQKKLLSIALALRAGPKLLGLDEPTAGVHPQLRTKIVDRLKSFNARGVSILVVEHDMHFIRQLCDRCIVLDRGAIIADCTPGDLTKNDRVVEAYLGRSVERPKVLA